MQENIQAYIDAYSNFILNHLLLAENPTGINIIQLGATPRVQLLSSSPSGLPYNELDYLFQEHTPVKLGDLSLGPSYELSLYFLCTETKFNTISADVFFESYYQLTGKDYLIMVLHTSNEPVTTSKLEASSVITCSLNLGLLQDYDIYKRALALVRKTVIRFYGPQLHSSSPTQPGAETILSHLHIDEGCDTINCSKNEIATLEDTATFEAISNPESLLTSAERQALSNLFTETSDINKSHNSLWTRLKGRS